MDHICILGIGPLRLTRGVFKCKYHLSLFNDIPLHEPLLEASSSPIPRVRIWSVESELVHNCTSSLLLLARARGIQQSFIRGGSVPRSIHFPCYISFLTEKLTFHIPLTYLKYAFIDSKNVPQKSFYAKRVDLPRIFLH